jgi:hypothetical protein
MFLRKFGHPLKKENFEELPVSNWIYNVLCHFYNVPILDANGYYLYFSARTLACIIPNCSPDLFTDYLDYVAFMFLDESTSKQGGKVEKELDGLTVCSNPVDGISLVVGQFCKSGGRDNLI